MNLLRRRGCEQRAVTNLRKLVTSDSIGGRLRSLMIHRLDPCCSLERCPVLETLIYVSSTSSNISVFTSHDSPAYRFGNDDVSFGIYLILNHLAITPEHDAGLALTTARLRAIR